MDNFADAAAERTLTMRSGEQIVSYGGERIVPDFELRRFFGSTLVHGSAIAASGTDENLCIPTIKGIDKIHEQ